MRLHVKSIAGGRVEVEGEDYHYLARVLRARAGDSVTLFDGEGSEADAVVLIVGGESMTLDAGAPRPVAIAPVRVTLLLAMLKGEKMELVIQKATELGVTRMVPLAAAHSVVRLAEPRARPRRERWQKVAREAARQCGRADVPEIAETAAVADAFRAAPAGASRFCLHESATDPLIIGPTPEVVLAIGPEGGFAPDEVAAAAESGFAIVRLGPRILRAETAAIAALAIAAFAIGDLGR